MSRAHALAPASDSGPRSPTTPAAEAIAARKRSRSSAIKETCYVERALLLWPRLERAKLRRAGNDPCRIAEIVGRRTSQPLEVVLAMLMRQSPAMAPMLPEAGGFEIAGPNPSRVALRIVRSEEGREIGVQNISPH